MNEIIQKIYVIHYNPLVQRKEYILNYFNNNGITNYEIRNKYQREDLTPEIKETYFKLNNLNPAQICITIEHIETYREIINTIDENKWALILEDDSLFTNDFISNINKYMCNVPSDAEYLDISDYRKINSPNMWERNLYTRTTCAYLIKKETCEKLLQTIIPFNNVIDHELNTQFKINNINVYWSNLSLIIQGSGNNTYRSSYIQNCVYNS
jgi:GR25 family glycosyltransferase involved in LPS biosynthesis